MVHNNNHANGYHKSIILIRSRHYNTTINRYGHRHIPITATKINTATAPPPLNPCNCNKTQPPAILARKQEATTAPLYQSTIPPTNIAPAMPYNNQPPQHENQTFTTVADLASYQTSTSIGPASHNNQPTPAWNSNFRCRNPNVAILSTRPQDWPCFAQH